MDAINIGIVCKTHFMSIHLILHKNKINKDVTCIHGDFMAMSRFPHHCPACGAFDLGLAVSVPLPIVTGIFMLLWFQSRLT